MKINVKPSLNKKWVKVLFKGAVFAKDRNDMLRLMFTVLDQPLHNKDGKMPEVSILLWSPTKLSDYNDVRKWMGLNIVQSEDQVEVPMIDEMGVEDWTAEWNVTRMAFLEEKGEKKYLNVTNMRGDNAPAATQPY